MSNNRSKTIGTNAETGLVRYLQANGWAHAERRALRGEFDAGDVTGTPGLCWEMKAGAQCAKPSVKQIYEWMAETETERRNAGAEIGVLVLRRPGVGPARAGHWLTYLSLHAVATLATDAPLLAALDGPLVVAPLQLTLATTCELLVAAGYGTPPKNGINHA
ncbi:hypothetical protein [Nonomuraea sp. bgisy101]|uniref:hypothetical protein n=1 Tax=Nonomuraea sp. bgisy101 TaxID=3413784 RepID=UPI003D73C13A